MNALNEATELLRAARPGEARVLLREILAQSPDDAEALHLLGIATAQSGDPGAAVESIRRAIALRPGAVEYLRSLGIAQRMLNQHTEAISTWNRAIELHPRWAALRADLGEELLRAGRFGDAAVQFQLAADLDGANHRHMHDLGVALACSGRQREALAATERAIELNPSFAAAYSQKASLLCELGRNEEALAILDRAIELDPSDAAAHNALGNLLSARSEWRQAVGEWRRSIELAPDSAPAHMNLALGLLRLGEWKEGSLHYEWRFKIGYPVRRFERPQWQGEDARGKSILFHTEGGLGDLVNYVRLLKLVGDRGAKLILECQGPLAPLLSSAGGFEEMAARGQPLPQFDFHCSLEHLRKVIELTVERIPAEIPYLFAPPERVARWSQRLADERKLRVGLVWSATRFPRGDPKTHSIEVFAPLAGVPDVKFFSLQKGDDAAQPPPAGMDFADYSSDLHDFADTAALIQNLDLVIGVDTSVIHVAGALGKPVWVLLPFPADFRWLLDRADSPWYPTMRLFREPGSGQYRAPISQMLEALRQFRR